jgi:hypothetical protein
MVIWILIFNVSFSHNNLRRDVSSTDQRGVIEWGFLLRKRWRIQHNATDIEASTG